MNPSSVTDIRKISFFTVLSLRLVRRGAFVWATIERAGDRHALRRFCGPTLDVAEWLSPRNGRAPAVNVSVAHLEDEERALVLGVLLEEVHWSATKPR
jgi:hypothetical protein